MSRRSLILVDGNTSGTGLLYIQAAQRLGLYPIILLADPAKYSHFSAESLEAIEVDTDNFNALMHVCSRLRASHDIAGITCFAGRDESLYVTVAKLCRHFDLPGPNPASIERCSDKFTQRQFLAQAGVPVPVYRLAANAMEVENSAAEIGLPVVLKPAEGSGSSGVRLCSNVHELAEHTTCLLGGSIRQSSPKILVEEFAQGPHFSAEIMGDEVIVIAALDWGQPPHFICRGCTYPAPLSNDEHKRIIEVSLNCLRALGLGWGPSNIEFRWTDRGPVVIEVNPRLAGIPTPQLVQLACGVDVITEHIKLAIGHECELRARHSHVAASRSFVPDRDGTLDWIGGVSRAAVIPGVVDVKFYVEPNTPIVRNGDSRDTIGRIFAASPGRAQTEAILQRAIDQIDWSITPFPAAREQELSSDPPQVVPGKM